MSLFSGGIGALSQITDKLDKLIGDPDSAMSAADAVVTSLSQFSKKANIISRAYIDDAVTDDPIVNDTLSIIHQIYTAMILTSINMNQYIENTKVRELLNVIATEEFTSAFQVAQESFNIAPTMAAGSTEPVKTGFKTPDVFREDPNKFPLGKVVEISLGVAGKQIKTDIFVQIMPIVTPNLVMDELLKLNFTPLLSQRWLQWKAGEISFWRDLIAARDIAKKKRAIRKADKEGIIAEILARQNNAQSKALSNVISNKQARHNIANTVMLFDSQTFKRGCSASSRDFTKYNDRQSYFNESFALMVVVVDSLYNKVDFYFNGIEGKATYSYSLIKNYAKSGKIDMMDIMKTISAGSAPRL